jgi:hypothetical protein
MKSSHSQRWDLVAGGAASLIAIAGLLLSIALGNTTSIGFGHLHPETQKFMAVLAATFLILVVIKAGLRYRRTNQTGNSACGLSLKRLLHPPRRRG